MECSRAPAGRQHGEGRTELALAVSGHLPAQRGLVGPHVLMAFQEHQGNRAAAHQDAIYGGKQQGSPGLRRAGSASSGSILHPLRHC